MVEGTAEKSSTDFCPYYEPLAGFCMVGERVKKELHAAKRRMGDLTQSPLRDLVQPLEEVVKNGAPCKKDQNRNKYGIKRVLCGCIGGTLIETMVAQGDSKCFEWQREVSANLVTLEEIMPRNSIGSQRLPTINIPHRGWNREQGME